MSEIQRITRKAKERTAEGRADPERRKDDGYVVDLIYLLEQSVMIIERISQGKSALSGDVLTIAKLQEILGQIEDENLKNFFLARLRDALEIEHVPDAKTIEGAKIE